LRRPVPCTKNRPHRQLLLSQSYVMADPRPFLLDVLLRISSPSLRKQDAIQTFPRRLDPQGGTPSPHQSASLAVTTRRVSRVLDSVLSKMQRTCLKSHGYVAESVPSGPYCSCKSRPGRIRVDNSRCFHRY
ncbi:hypothetical protein LTR49_028844, partial [Elasticomyces elasticus]